MQPINQCSNPEGHWDALNFRFGMNTRGTAVSCHHENPRLPLTLMYLDNGLRKRSSPCQALSGHVGACIHVLHAGARTQTDLWGRMAEKEQTCTPWCFYMGETVPRARLGILRPERCTSPPVVLIPLILAVLLKQREKMLVSKQVLRVTSCQGEPLRALPPVTPNAAAHPEGISPWIRPLHLPPATLSTAPYSTEYTHV